MNIKYFYLERIKANGRREPVGYSAIDLAGFHKPVHTEQTSAHQLGASESSSADGSVCILTLRRACKFGPMLDEHDGVEFNETRRGHRNTSSSLDDGRVAFELPVDGSVC